MNTSKSFVFSERPPEVTRVVVAGVGAITSLGSSATALWEGVKAGHVAIRPVRSLPMESYRTRIGGEVQEIVLPEHGYLRPDGHREPVIDFSLKAAEEALEVSGLKFAKIPAERWGVVMGTCLAGIQSATKWYSSIQAGRSADPGLLCLFMPQGLAEAVSSAFGLKGPVLSLSTACAAGANAIGYAAELIRANHADVVLAGGADTLSSILYAGFHCLESLSPEPAAPYSRNRSGLSLGEGSGMLVLVREDLARQFEVPILAEVLGYGLSADGYHPTAPHPQGEGASRAMKAALEVSGISPEQVQYVNGHGTGTAKNDSAETKAIRRALGSAADHVAVSSTKSMIGHLLGAAGAVEGIVTVKALQEQIAPPTANYTVSDPECDLDYVPGVARPAKIDVALSNSFAFGGNNACIVLSKAQPDQILPAREPDRVVVTGMSMLTPAGCDPDEVWQALVAEQVCTRFEQGAWVGRIQGLDPSPFLTPRDRRRMDRLGLLSVVSAQMALADANLVVNEANRHRIGIVFGTGIGPMESMENFTRPLLEEGTPAANPAIFPNTVFNAAAGLVAMHTNAVGPNSTVTCGHAAGASALCYGYDLVASGQADVMLCLAADALTDTVIRAYRELGLVATDENGLTSSAGFALAEAGVVLVLERLANAQSRGARIYGEIVGYGITSDADGIGHFDLQGRGLERAMRLAQEISHVGAPFPSSTDSTVPLLWASAAGYQAADDAEAAAFQSLFGTVKYVNGGTTDSQEASVYVIAPKKLLGEPGGVGGMLNAGLALKTWQHGKCPSAVANITPPQTALINSSSLGGTHFSIALRAYQEGEGNV